MKEELISVIIPIYKVEKYLEKCVVSVLNQTYENIEVILVDDGSPDNCPKLCDDYERKDKRIKVIHQKNGGLSSARNTGISIASGNYIFFIDSDDYIENDTLEFLYKDIKNTNSDISICGFKYKYENSSKEKLCKYNNKKFIVTGKNILRNILNEYAVLTVIAWNKLYKKEVFKEIRYPVGKYHEDEIIAIKIFSSVEKVSYNLKPLYNYMQRNGSITSNFNIKRLDAFDAYNERKEIFKNNKDLELYDLNEKFKSWLLSSLLISYFRGKSKDLSEYKIKEMISELNKVNKYLYKSKHIKIKNKIVIFFYYILTNILYIKNKFLKCR